MKERVTLDAVPVTIANPELAVVAAAGGVVSVSGVPGPAAAIGCRSPVKRKSSLR